MCNDSDPGAACDLHKVIYSLWVSTFPLAKVIHELFLACCQYRHGATHDLSVCETPRRTRLLLCPGLGMLFNEIFPITQVANSSWRELGSLCGLQLSSNLCQASRAHGEVVTSPKPCLHLSLQQILPGNGCNPINPPDEAALPPLAQRGAAHSQPRPAKSWKVPKHLHEQC